jgi:hypothetical protein
MTQAGIKRKVLFITPDYMDYTEIIFQGIEKYLEAEVHLITTTGSELKFSYRNSLHRVENFFSKLFLRKNQKKTFYNRIIDQKLQDIFNDHDQFDDIFILRPDLIKEHLQLIKQHGKRMIAYFWDGFARIPGGKETIGYFNKFLSFEPKDAKQYNLSFLPNFYSPDLSAYKNLQSQFDLAYVASYDERAETLERILGSLRILELKTNINIVSLKNIDPSNRNENINWFTDVLPRKETLRIMKDSNVVLDIAQSKQEGLSFRIFEAMALEKKVLTTNESIAVYDLYDPKNIFIWKNETTVPSKEFFTTPYSPIAKEIVEKYSLESWIRKIFA